LLFETIYMTAANSLHNLNSDGTQLHAPLAAYGSVYFACDKMADFQNLVTNTHS